MKFLLVVDEVAFLIGGKRIMVDEFQREELKKLIAIVRNCKENPEPENCNLICK